MWPAKKTRAGHSPWKRFSLNLALIVSLAVSALFVGILVNQQQAIETELANRARTAFDSIVLARLWNANYGGIFVEKKPGVQSNPYLKNPDIETKDGKIYTMKNPALMTREISEIAEKRGIFKFHITSLKLRNADNAPDEFERAALMSFERGEKEVIAKEKSNGSTVYRYMAPLFIEAPCLSCHADQGYKVGDVRGGISVKFNIDEVERDLARHRGFAFGLFFLMAITLLGIIYRLVIVLQRKLDAAEERLRTLAVTDELTGLKNRRYVMERLAQEFERAVRHRHVLSCIMFDLDCFKRVNDTYGHDAGDMVLRATTSVAQSCCRQIDTLGRYGGEEFLLLLPETNGDNARTVAERIRQAIGQLKINLPDGRTLSITVSMGVSTLIPGISPDILDMNKLIKHADDALYRAKEAGRNRVESAIQAIVTDVA